MGRLISPLYIKLNTYLKMKKSIAPLIMMFFFTLLLTLSGFAQVKNTVVVETHSHNVKVATTFETPEHTKRLVVHNDGKWSQLYILFRHKQGDLFWESIAVVTVPGRTKGIFYVEDGFNYGFEIEGMSPKTLGGKGRRFKVKNKDRKQYYGQ